MNASVAARLLVEITTRGGAARLQVRGTSPARGSDSTR
jgi:hypothetical protein